MAVDRGGCVVRGETGEVNAELAGKLRFTAELGLDLPCVGDWVRVQYQGGGSPAVIHEVLPRKTLLRRKYAGKTVDFQAIAANIDTAFIVQSCHFDFNVRRLDRYLVVAHEGGITPVIVLSKTDLVSPEELDSKMEQIRHAGITAEILPLSNLTGSGIDEFRQHLVPDSTYCLLGSSGVGKSTLINRLIGHEELGTKEVSATGEGTHATSRRQLVVLENGSMIIDTPGMRELGIVGASDGVSESFADVRDVSENCRFSDCTHAGEPGCAVREAMARGELSEERYESYLKLKKESAYHEMSYAEKRKKDRSFGQFIKSVQKGKKQREKRSVTGHQYD